jgi:azurin
MKLHKLIAIAIASTPLFFVPTLAQTAKPKPEPAATAPAAKGAVRTVEIAGTDQMKYDIATIPAKRNEQLRVRLTVKGTMPKIAMAHNWVLLKLGTSQVKFIAAGVQARETDFVAPEVKDQVIAKTALAGAGETVDVTFKVPGVAGEYPFVCTFPGHFQAGMRGTLAVK